MSRAILGKLHHLEMLKISNNFLRWKAGRQQTGYQKMLLATALWPIKFDMYLLRFNEGHEIPTHRDQVESGKHFRLNIILKHPKRGGEFKCEEALFSTRSIKLFRPDICEHSVSKIVEGNRYVFSLGWLRN